MPTKGLLLSHTNLKFIRPYKILARYRGKYYLVEVKANAVTFKFSIFDPGQYLVRCYFHNVHPLLTCSNRKPFGNSG